MLKFLGAGERRYRSLGSLSTRSSAHVIWMHYEPKFFLFVLSSFPFPPTHPPEEGIADDGELLYAPIVTFASLFFLFLPGLPGPANTPTHEENIDDDDGELLYAPRRDLWMLTDQPGIDLLTAGPAALEHLQQVWVGGCGRGRGVGAVQVT